MVMRGMAVLAVALALVAPGCGGGEVPVVSRQDGDTPVNTEGSNTEGSNTEGSTPGSGTGGNSTTTEPSD